MARRRYRRYRRRRGRWSTNLAETSGNITASPGQWFYPETLMKNPVQNINTVSQIYTIKNIEITFTIEYPFSPIGSDNAFQLEDITAYIMYVPQGMQITADYNIQHPEYIMNYRYLGSPSFESLGQQYQPYKLRTRLARKLNTGDNIVLFLKGLNQSSSETYTLRLSGLIRWWTKAN